MSQERPATTNGMAVASLVLGLVGSMFGLVPLTWWIAAVCGVLALIFGVVGIRNAGKGAPYRGMAIAGTVLAVVALSLAVVGFGVIADVLRDIDRELEQPQ